MGIDGGGGPLRDVCSLPPTSDLQVGSVQGAQARYRADSAMLGSGLRGTWIRQMAAGGSTGHPPHADLAVGGQSAPKVEKEEPGGRDAHVSRAPRHSEASRARLRLHGCRSARCISRALLGRRRTSSADGLIRARRIARRRRLPWFRRPKWSSSRSTRWPRRVASSTSCE